MKPKGIPFYAIGNDELKDKPDIGSTTICPHCKKRHKVSYGWDIEGEVCTIMSFIRCGEDIYLVAVNNKKL